MRGDLSVGLSHFDFFLDRDSFANQLLREQKPVELASKHRGVAISSQATHCCRKTIQTVPTRQNRVFARSEGWHAELIICLVEMIVDVCDVGRRTQGINV